MPSNKSEGSSVPPKLPSPSRISITSTSPQSQKLEWFRTYFRPHFEEWVFGPINRLVHTDDALVGFILMACAIDYLAGFWWGKNTRGHVFDAYTGFIDSYFVKDRYDSKALYHSIRNGLVHLFTIKNRKYALTHNNPGIHLQTSSNGQVILDAGSFRNELIEATRQYFDDVESNPALLEKLVSRYLRHGFLDLTSR